MPVPTKYAVATYLDSIFRVRTQAEEAVKGVREIAQERLPRDFGDVVQRFKAVVANAAIRVSERIQHWRYDDIQEPVIVFRPEAYCDRGQTQQASITR